LKGLFVIALLALVGPCWAEDGGGTVVSVGTQSRDSFGGSELRDVYVIHFGDCTYTAEGDHITTPANAIAVGPIEQVLLTGDYIQLTPRNGKIHRLTITTAPECTPRLATLVDYEGSRVTETRVGRVIPRVQSTAIELPVFTIQFDNLVYTSTGANRDDGHDLIVGDRIRAARQGDYILIQTPGGKPLKTKINKIERAPK
jgi:hypothetical protein